LFEILLAKLFVTFKFQLFQIPFLGNFKHLKNSIIFEILSKILDELLLHFLYFQEVRYLHQTIYFFIPFEFLLTAFHDFQYFLKWINLNKWESTFIIDWLRMQTLKSFSINYFSMYGIFLAPNFDTMNVCVMLRMISNVF
jgi:hypothetical protein